MAYLLFLCEEFAAKHGEQLTGPVTAHICGIRGLVQIL